MKKTVNLLILFFVLGFVSCNTSDMEWYDINEAEHLILEEDEIPKIVGENFSLLMDIAISEKNNTEFDSSDVNDMLILFDEACSENQKYIAKRGWSSVYSRNSEIRSSFDFMPDSIIYSIYDGYMNPDYNMLFETIQEIKSTKWYLEQNGMLQREIDIDLKSIAVIRDVIIEHTSNLPASRMSPGDRMIWRETVIQLDDPSRKTVFQATVSGIAMVTNSVMSFVLTVITFI